MAYVVAQRHGHEAELAVVLEVVQELVRGVQRAQVQAQQAAPTVAAVAQPRQFFVLRVAAEKKREN